MKPKKKKFTPKQDKLDKLLDYLWYSSPWNKDKIQQIVKEEIEKMIKDAKQATLTVIANGEGWEESYDHYAKKFGLPLKYNAKKKSV